MTASTESIMRINNLLPNRSSLKPGLTFFGLAAVCLLLTPDIAAASGGITEFSSPLEKVVNTVTGDDDDDKDAGAARTVAAAVAAAAVASAASSVKYVTSSTRMAGTPHSHSRMPRVGAK